MTRRFAFVGMILTAGMTPALALLMLLGGFFPGLPPTYAAEIHVCASGCPYSSIQAAVDASSDGDVIKIAAGAYTDVHARPRHDVVTAGVVTQVVYISKTITIRGGYTTTNWLMADPGANPTILDARGQGRVLYVTGDISPTIEALRLTGGNASGLGGVGGGVYLYRTAATLNGNMVASNAAGIGGGLYLSFSPAMLGGNTVISNTAYYDGGGLYLASSPASVSGNAVVSNVADGAGGGLYLYGSAAALSGNTVISNIAYYDGGGLYLSSSAAALNGNVVVSNTAESGGGLYLFYSAATLNGNVVASNTAYTGGGLALGSSAAAFSGNIVTANHARYGGGLSLYGPGTFGGNIVASNTADYGGGLDLAASAATFVNNIVTDNHAGIEGSGLRIGYDSSPRLYHTTVARNSGGEGSGVLIAGSSHADLVNTILVAQTVGITIAGGSSAVLSGTLWGSGAWGNGANWGGDGAITPTANVFGTPDFVFPGAGDYHIGPHSAARDAGVNTSVLVDIDNQPRPLDEVDIGADEYWAQQIVLPLVPRKHAPGLMRQ